MHFSAILHNSSFNFSKNKNGAIILKRRPHKNEIELFLNNLGINKTKSKNIFTVADMTN